MATSIYPSTRRNVRGNKTETKEKVIFIVSASYVTDFIISIQFNTGEKKVVDFLPLFHKYVKGPNLKYFSIENFKKFIVKNGNIFWGKNEDVIFTLDLLYDFASKQKETVLYVVK
jgi:Protein of unknown function (DUF2442)